MKNQIEAIDLIALAIHEIKSRGTPRHAAAVKLHDEAIALWRAKFDPKCPHCGKSINKTK